MQFSYLRTWMTQQPSWIYVTLISWLLAGAAIATIAGAVYFQTAAQLSYTPIDVESAAWIPGGKNQGLHIFDTRSVHQRFIPRSAQISGIEIGLINSNQAPDDARVTITITDEHRNTLAETAQTVSSFLQHSLTQLPISLSVHPGQPYWISIATSGVEKGKDLTLAYNSNSERYSDGQLYITKQENGRATRASLQGNIGFQTIRDNSAQAAWKSIQTSASGYLLGIATSLWVIGIIALGILAVIKPTLPVWCIRAFTPITLKTHPIDWKDAALSIGVGLAMAVFVTLPFYTSLGKTSVFGDVHRALIFRGVARDALLSETRMGLWEPYMCGGAPLLANSESAQLDPLFLLTLAFGESLGLRLSVTAMLLIGFTGAYILTRKYFATSRSLSLLAGAVFTFSGFQMLGYANGAYAWLPAGWIPWYFFFLITSFRKPISALGAAAILSFMFFGGGIHIFAWSLAIGGIFSLVAATIYRNTYPLLAYGISLVTMVGLTAIKIIPGIEMQTATSLPAEFVRPPAFIPPLQWMYKMFASRDQLATPAWFFEPADDYFRWFDFGSYIGIIPITLAAIGLYRIRKDALLTIFALTAGICLLMTFGLPPWNLLIQISPLDEILRNPQRARAVLVLFLGSLAAVGGTHLMRTLPSKKVRIALPILITALVLLDLGTFHRTLFFKTYTLDTPTLDVVQPFERVTYSYSDQPTGHHKSSYINYRANQGVTDSCLPFMAPFDKFTAGSDNKDQTKTYQGEAWLLGPNTATLTAHSINEFEVTVTSKEDTWLLTNTNYFPGWRTVPERTVRPVDGLLAAHIEKSDTVIRFIYDPASYTWGKATTILTIILALGWGGAMAYIRWPNRTKRS